jgi:nicotinamide mononucleotide (NMN) deamidase PncC
MTRHTHFQSRPSAMTPGWVITLHITLVSLLSACTQIKTGDAAVTPATPHLLNEEHLCGNRPALLCRLEFDNYRLAAAVGKQLAARGWFLATAESITAGNLVGTLGKTQWAGKSIAGAIVAYNTSVKNALLGVEDTSDVAVISKRTAHDMVVGLRDSLREFNPLQKRRGRPYQLNVYVALTGASTTWQDLKPRMYVGIALGDTAPEVRTFNLNQQLAGDATERAHNIQLAINKTLIYLLEVLDRA